MTTPLKTHGGKHYLAKRIIEVMPPHLHYVEPFCGGASVLLQRDPHDPRLWLGDSSSQRGVSEVINDLDGHLVNFWRVLADPVLFLAFQRQMQAIPLSRELWEQARDHRPTGDVVADASAFFVLARQSRAGLRKSFTPLSRSRTRRGMNGNASEWLSAVDGLADVHDRLRGVVIENKPALDLIREHDGPHTLFYCDPPYLPRTRTAKKAYGPFEMTEAEHQNLLDLLRQCKGKAMLSGYPSALYDTALAGWSRHTFDVPNQASGAKKKDRETEVLWCNF
jgi:DNA adenine methylase